MGSLLYIKCGETRVLHERDRLSREIAKLQQQLGRLTEAALNGRKITVTETRARRILNLRTSRRLIFGMDLFGEPAWDMLLRLYDAQLQGRTEHVTSLCAASGVSPSAALRWIHCLLDGNWIFRESDPTDPQRRLIISLTPRGLDAMERFFSQPEFTGGL